MRTTVLDVLEKAYVEGWRKACEMYAVWNSGEQIVGMNRRLAEVQRDAAEVAKPYFENWLERQKQTFDGE